MCGRYNLITDVNALMIAFDILTSVFDEDDIEPRYNIAPSSNKNLTLVPIVRQGEKGRVLARAVWPLIPVWGKGQLQKYSTANATAERMTTAPTYRHAWKHGQRCLIPATGFYEWQVVEGQRWKQPYNIVVKNLPVFAFGGLWESSRREDDVAVESCTIVTTRPNTLMKRIHNRMPVIIAPDDYAAWLNAPPDEAIKLARPFPTKSMQATPISTRVNNPRFNSPECLLPD